MNLPTVVNFCHVLSQVLYIVTIAENIPRKLIRLKVMMACSRLRLNIVATFIGSSAVLMRGIWLCSFKDSKRKSKRLRRRNWIRQHGLKKNILSIKRKGGRNGRYQNF
jgi:hypothetical protein